MSKKYQVLYADPPWSYRNKRTGGSMKSGSAQKYETVPMEDLKDFPIRDIADREAILFLWATTPLLPEIFEVLSAWKFKYKTMITWRKIMSLGMGFWFRVQTEHLLVAKRGNFKALRCQKPNFIQCKVGEHSEKPEEFRELIETAIEDRGDLNKIELFARKKVNGWDVWGNEVESDIEVDWL